MEKRKREDDGGSKSNGRRPAPREDDAVKRAVPADEEVEEFFAILKRIQIALKYFQERDDRKMTAAAPRWSPTFVLEDFDGVKTETESAERIQNRNVGLDLNSDPVGDISDDAD